MRPAAELAPGPTLLGLQA